MASKQAIERANRLCAVAELYAGQEGGKSIRSYGSRLRDEIADALDAFRTAARIAPCIDPVYDATFAEGTRRLNEEG